MSPAELEDLSRAWEENAQRWLAWARTPGHDLYFWAFNFPAFAELVPEPGRLTVDIGCGEGRLGRWLAERGHRVVGIDSSPTLAAAAAEAGGYEEVVVGDAVQLPWPRDSADLAIAFMTLQDMPDAAGAIAEIARVLEPGGVLCLAITHPLNPPEPALQDYFSETRVSEEIERAGLQMRFDGASRPLESYTRALSRNGFVIEELTEPRPSAEAVTASPALAAAASRPFFLHLRCRYAGAEADRGGPSRHLD